jgi:rhamnosyltransferase
MGKNKTADIIPPAIHNICLLIVSYNPTQQIKDLIEALPVSLPVVIVDNNSQGESLEILNSLKVKPHLFIIENDKNLGIAKALNQGILHAAKMKLEWVLTFDQDSLPLKNILDILFAGFANSINKEQLAMLGVNYSGNASRRLLKKISDGYKNIEEETLITSGSLLSVKAYKHAGPFREDFFIDCVDLEYSLRLQSLGYKIEITAAIGLVHECGTVISKKVGPFHFTSSCHNELRRYYMARNHVILSKKYLFRFPYYVIKKNYFFLKALINMLAVDENKFEKLRKSFTGIVHGLFAI